MSLLIVTQSSGLLTAYGPAGQQQILTKLQAYAASLPANSAQVALLDDPVSMNPFGPPASPNNPSSLHDAISRVTAAVTSIETILIIGDNNVFPYWQLPNPVTDRSLDPDLQILTDNPYGDVAGSDPNSSFEPPIIVGRICAGAGESAASLGGLLDNAIANHAARPLRGGYVEITNRAWTDSSASVCSAVAGAGRVLVCPNDAVTAANRNALDCALLYCNLHGFTNSSSWNGSDPVRGFVPAVTPDSFDAQFVSGTTVFTEACYGLQIANRSTSGSCALTLLSCGAAAVVGATGLAFGSATEKPLDLIDADALTQAFFDTALNGDSIADCLRAARKNFAGNLDPYQKKTLLQFQILGDPTLAAL